ncbi:MAG: sulfotransferase [Flavobacteriales bacterium]|nr:sulfotransferase [Flavobacteriales bacterium]
MNKKRSHIPKKEWLPFYPIFAFISIIFSKKLSWSKVHNIISWPLRYLICEPFRLIELLIESTQRQKITTNPIIILGHWRSGTTFMHELLIQDKKFAYFNIYKVMFPDIYLTTEKLLKPLLQRISSLLKLQLAYHRRDLNFDIPGEEEFALQTLLHPKSAYWAATFPRNYKQFYDFTKSDYSPSKSLMQQWHRVVSKLYTSTNKRLVLKSPINTIRIKEILDFYPKAKFIYIHRNPEDVYFSNIRALSTNIPYAFQNFSTQQYEDVSLEAYKRFHDLYVKQRSLIPEENLLEVHFENIISNPTENLSKVYQFIGEHFDRKTILGFLKKNPYKPKGQRISEEKRHEISDELKSYQNLINVAKKDENTHSTR